MGASAAAGAKKTDPNSARELLCIICMGLLFRCIHLGHTLRGAAVMPRGANSIAAFNLGNEKDALPSLPSQNAAREDFTTDFTVRLCLQEWGEVGDELIIMPTNIFCVLFLRDLCSFSCG